MLDAGLIPGFRAFRRRRDCGIDIEMNFASELDNKIEAKEQEIDQLRHALSQAEAYLQALHDMRQMLPKQTAGGEKAPRLRSDVTRVREILKKEGKPMHVEELLTRLGKEKTAKASLTSALSTYVRRGQIFTRPGPNTFGLIESDSVGSENGTHVPDQLSLPGDSAESEKADQTVTAINPAEPSPIQKP